MGKATCGSKRTELLYDMTENRIHVELKDLALDGTTWNQKLRESLS